MSMIKDDSEVFRARTMRLTPKAFKALREDDIRAGRWPLFMQQLAAQVAAHKPLVIRRGDFRSLAEVDR